MKIRVTVEGSERELDASEGQSLMNALRDAGTAVRGDCGGSGDCGTCHVYIDHAWISRLRPRRNDENMMLEAISELVNVRSNSRLSCQIPMVASLENLSVEIGPIP